MSQEPSIDDILRLLKESVGTEDSETPPKKKSKGHSADGEEKEDSYAIDPEFFLDVEKEEQEKPSEDDVAPWEDEEEEIPEDEEEEIPEDEEEEIPEDEEEEIPEDEEEEFFEDEEEEIPEDEEEEIPEDEEEEIPEDEEEEFFEDEEEEIPEDEEEDPEFTDYFSEEDPSVLTFEELQQELELEEEDDGEEDEEAEEIEEIEETEEIEENGEEPYVLPDENLQSLPIDSLISPEEEKKEEPKKVTPAPTGKPTVTPAMAELMRQLGCEDDLPELSRGTAYEEPSGAMDREGVRALRNVRKKKERSALIRLILLGLITLAVGFYDLLPLWDVDIPWLYDFIEYPGSYLLIGWQLLVFGAVCLWKPLLTGIKKLFCATPDLYSAMFLVLAFLTAYDVILAFAPGDGGLPQMFHFPGCVCMLILLGTEYAMIRRESYFYDILGSEQPRYTLAPSVGGDSLGEKMYRGGMERERKIYRPGVVAPLVKGENEFKENSVYSPFMTGALIPVCLIVIATAVVGMAFEYSLRESLGAAMIMLFAALPLSALAAICIPLWFSARWLKKRGSALGDFSSVCEYSECDVMIFRDLHLFRKCRMEETGVVFYDQAHVTDIMKALEILYSHIGGPMSELFRNVPEKYRAKSIRIRRISRGGIEAFVDRKQILLVGDSEFMKRYGLSFPESEERAGRTTLYVSLDGGVSAKINARYVIEPIFEMLVNRMAAEGIHCVVETFDPLVCSEFIASLRRPDGAPISVVHKNAEDLYLTGEMGEPTVTDTKMAVLASRLKLAESLVWCRRIQKVHRGAELTGFIFSGIGLIATAVLFGFGGLSLIHEYWLALWGILPVVFVWLLCLIGFPKRFYFTAYNHESELIRKDAKQERRQRRDAARAKAKQAKRLRKKAAAVKKKMKKKEKTDE